jgi:hypothetical protein
MNNFKHRPAANAAHDGNSYGTTRTSLLLFAQTACK